MTRKHPLHGLIVGHVPGFGGPCPNPPKTCINACSYLYFEDLLPEMQKVIEWNLKRSRNMLGSVRASDDNDRLHAWLVKLAIRLRRQPVARDYSLK